MRNVIWLQSICRQNGLEVSERQAVLLEEYVSLLLRANAQVNLISRRDEPNVWKSHILHSISPLFRIDFREDCVILDLGTGGGLPGIPWKILRPATQFVLVDSIQKKIRAVDEMISKLKLTDIKTACSRVEDLGKSPDFAHRMDVVVCRGVAPLKKLIAWSRPLLKPALEEAKMNGENKKKSKIPAGTLVAFKGGDLRKEIDDAMLHGNVESIREIPLTFNGSEDLPLSEKKIVLVRL